MKHWRVLGCRLASSTRSFIRSRDFDGLRTGKPAAPTFSDALATDLVTEAVLKSAKSGHWGKRWAAPSEAPCGTTPANNA